MITAENFKTLKQVSISINPEKSKSRILDAFKSTDKKQKEEIRELTGFTNFNNFYNAGRTGVASPKVVLSLATILDISPKYFTGEIDDKESCDAADIADIFAKYGGQKGRKASAAAKKAAKAPKAAKTEKAPKAAKKRGRPAKAVKPEKKVADKSNKTVAPKAMPVRAAKLPDVKDDSLVKLLEALAIRAKYSSEAAATYEQVKGLLLR
jgi:hypothetical protein